MATPPRKSQLKKAPQSSLVEALTTSAVPAVQGGEVQRQEAVVTFPSAPTAGAQREDEIEPREPKRPGPGRPRGKRRMEPLSSKIEMGLRDEMDAYLDAHGMTVVDFLDAAIRGQLQK